jgi:hypothetical protein
MCLLVFYITYILTSTTATFECISWLINVTDNNDARWKPEINCLFKFSKNYILKSGKCSDPFRRVKFRNISIGDISVASVSQFGKSKHNVWTS